jgi:hypothetical protein
MVHFFHILRFRTHFLWYEVRRVQFSRIALSDSIWTVPKVLGPLFMFYATGLIFDSSRGIGSNFLILRFRTRFRWHQKRRVRFSCFALSDSFSAVPTAPSPLFMFRAPELIFGRTEAVGFSFHVLCSQTCFGRYLRHQVYFSCFVLWD